MRNVQIVWIIRCLEVGLEDLWRRERRIFGGKVEDNQAI
jgi:hypothetical protein